MRRLLDAGIEVFARRGFHAARVDDIVKAAKTSHGTFYLYFANKEDLFQALVADIAEEMRGLADSLGSLSAGPDGKAELRSWLERFTSLYEHYGPILRTWTEAEIDQNELGRIGTDLLGDLALALSERIAASGARDVDPAIAGLALVAMTERFKYFVLSGQVNADRVEMLDILTAVMHDALFAADG